MQHIIRGISLRWLVGLWLLPAMLLSNAWAFYNSQSAMGTNTNEIMEDDSSAPFVDLFKMSVPFREARPLTQGDVKYDRYGWPVSIPTGGKAGTRFLNKLPAGTIPRGFYTVLYDGQGTIEYGNDATLTEHTEGRDIILIDPGKDNELSATLYIKTTNPQNYIRNIRILPQGGICASNPFLRVAGAGQCKGDYLAFEQHSSKIIFNPDYLKYMRDFRVIRFMNMSGITRNPVYAWEDRASIDQATWGGAEGIRGAPMEVMVELANRLHADPWFSMPHAASNDFIQRWAEYVAEHLDPTLKVYVEYTNEAWNGIFNQHAYMKQQGQRLNLDADPNQAAYKYYSQRSVEVFKTWESVLGKERLVRVMAGLVGSTQMTKTILNHNGAYKHTDAYAVAPYVYGDTAALRAARSVNDIFRIMTDPKYAHSLPKEIESIQRQAAVTKSFGVDLIAYEGGQHLVDWQTKANDQHPNPLFYAANRHPQMGVIYQRLLEGWKAAGGKLFVHYTSPRIYQKYGSFGAKEFITQPDTQAPKHKAMLNFMRSNNCWWAGCSGNTLVRHTKPAATMEILKAQSEALDATAPQSEQPLEEETTPSLAVAANSAKRLDPVQHDPNSESFVAGDTALIVQAKNPRNPLQTAKPYSLRRLVAGNVSDMRDLAAVWQAAWDSRNLYLRISVADERLINDSSAPWEDDALELFIDADGSGLNQYDQSNDFHLIFRAQDGKVGLGRNSPAITPSSIQSRSVRDAKGYMLEVQIPWASLQVQPQAGMRIGLDVHLDDDDDGNQRDAKLTWRDTRDEAWRNPSMFGQAVLGN